MKSNPYKRSGDKEQLLLKLLFLYKRRCESLGTASNSVIQHWLECGVEAEKLELMKVHEPMGPLQMRVIMEILVQQKYNNLTAICVWKSKIGDQGVRNICRYLQLVQNNEVILLDLLENQLTELSCEFIGKTLKTPFVQIQHLKLDNNLIGDNGICNLAVGLKCNSILTKLSLKYCEITENGMIYIQEILSNICSKIRSIKLQGNPLGNKGVLQFLKAVQANDVLQKINIADTGLNLLDFVSEKIFICQNLSSQNSNNNESNQEKQPTSKYSSSLKSSISNSTTKQKKSSISNSTIKYKKCSQPHSITKKKNEPTIKLTRKINSNDNTLSANILRLFLQIMPKKVLIRKYDLRFNPISQDAAYILFEIIEQNLKIIDVQLNNNVSNEILANLDVITKKRKKKFAKIKAPQTRTKKK